MKLWLCNSCGKRRESYDDVMIRTCRICQEPMEEFKKEEEEDDP